MVGGSAWLMVVVGWGDSSDMRCVVGGGGGWLAVLRKSILRFCIYNIILDVFMQLIFF